MTDYSLKASMSTDRLDLSSIRFEYEGSLLDADELLCKIGPEGLYDLADKLKKIADEDVSDAITTSYEDSALDSIASSWASSDSEWGEKTKPKVTSIFYFGTELNYPGHYFWELGGNLMQKSKIGFDDIPFDPESFMNRKPFGEVEFFRFDNYAICAISGSCYDQRMGSKSVFWVDNNFTKLGELKDIILNIPAAKRIIDKMPFEVKW